MKSRTHPEHLHSHQSLRKISTKRISGVAPLFESLQSAAYYAYAMHSITETRYRDPQDHDYALHRKFGHGKTPEHINAFELQTIAMHHDPMRLILRTLARLCGYALIPKPDITNQHLSRETESLLENMHLLVILIASNSTSPCNGIGAENLVHRQKIERTGTKTLDLLQQYLSTFATDKTAR